MASKQDQNAASRGILECSICLEAFKMPKCLPCIHTFCFECLEKYGKDEQPGDEMPCPLCRQLFKIPAEGFKKLPNNIFIEQIATTAKLFASLAIGGVKCESCDKGDATHYCVDCAESMCDVCSGVHRKQKATRAHKVVSLSEKEGSQVYMRARPAYCDTHEDKQLELYCYEVNCSKAICLLCSAMEHRNHLCADIQTSSRKFCDELISCYPHLDESAEMNATEQKSLDEQKSNLLEQISACERAVQERGEQLKRIVDEQCREVLSQLEKFKDERIKAIQARKEEVDGQSLMLSSLRAYMEELVKKGSACAISQSAKDLVARAKQLHADQVEFRKGSLSPDRVRFEPANVADITSGRMALIGWISVNGFLVRRMVQGRKRAMNFAIIKNWCEPTDHSSNCYFSLVDPFKRRTGKSAPPIMYPDIPSSIAPVHVPQCPELPVPTPPERDQPSSGESSKSAARKMYQIQTTISQMRLKRESHTSPTRMISTI